MKRRHFIKSGALFVPTIFVHRLIRAQANTYRDISWLINRNAPVAGGGGPTLIAQDNFDSYANTSSLGAAADWATVQGTVTVNNPLGSGDIFGDTAAFCRRKTETFSANQRSESTITGVSIDSSFTILAVRCQSGAATGYTWFVDGVNYYVIDYIAGVQNVITSGALSGLSAGTQLAIEANGTGSATRLKIQKNLSGSWVDVATGIDPGTSHYIDGGKPGAGGQGNATGFHLDNWKGYDL